MSRTSWLHRLLRVEPGHVPRWFLSSSGCTADAASVLSHLVIAAIAIGIASSRPAILAAVVRHPYVAASIGFLIMMTIEFRIDRVRSVERKARARIRQAAESSIPIRNDMPPAQST